MASPWLTIVGVGTSLPEATASVIASLKRQNAMAFGNIVGSNIFNGLGILGVTGLALPMRFGAGFSPLDGVILVSATALMFVFALTHRRILRWEGALMLVAYGVYLALLISRVS